MKQNHQIIISVRNIHQNEFSKYLEDSNERNDKGPKTVDPKVDQKSICGISNSKFANHKTENSLNIEKPAADQPGSEDKSASNIPIKKSLYVICVG